MEQFLSDMAFIFANAKVAAGLLALSAVCFALYALDAETLYRGAPIDLIGWATGVLGLIVLLLAGVRRLRKKS